MRRRALLLLLGAVAFALMFVSLAARAEAQARVEFPVMDTTRPALFLDIDGVLNSWAWWQIGCPGPRHVRKTRRFAPAGIAALNTIVREVAPLVVLSSSWRIAHTVEYVLGELRVNGYEGTLDGATPEPFGLATVNDPEGYPYKRHRHYRSDLWHSHRGDEIRRWREESGHVGPFAIIDDDCDMVDLGAHHVRTYFATGLTDARVPEVLALLRAEPARSAA